MRRLILTITAALLIFAFATKDTLADPIQVTPSYSDSSVEATINSSWCYGCWIDVVLNEGLGTGSAWLEAGDSVVFDFFDVYVGALIGGASVTVDATLGFSNPTGATSATGEGGFVTIAGLLSGGYLIWDQPNSIDLGDGTWLDVSFEDLAVGGLGNSATVSATVTRSGAASAISVSEPGSLGLLGLGLLVLAFAVRRRQTSVRA